MLQYANPRSFVAHNHNPDVDAIEVAALKVTLKERAVVSDVQPARLLAGALLNASDAAKDRVKMQTARRGIRCFKQGMVPPESATRRQLDFVGPWRTTGRVLARDQSASLEDWQKLARSGEIVWFYNGSDRKKTGKIARNGHFGRAVSESWLNP